jgi:hypothetical protein
LEELIEDYLSTLNDRQRISLFSYEKRVQFHNVLKATIENMKRIFLSHHSSSDIEAMQNNKAQTKDFYVKSVVPVEAKDGSGTVGSEIKVAFDGYDERVACEFILTRSEENQVTQQQEESTVVAVDAVDAVVAVIEQRNQPFPTGVAIAVVAPATTPTAPVSKLKYAPNVATPSNTVNLAHVRSPAFK